jgi:hypothetical protein
MPFTVDAFGLTRLVKKLQRATPNIKRDTKRAVGTARRVASAEATKAVRAAYTVKRQRIASRWKVTKVDEATLSFDLIGTGREISAMHFTLRKTKRGYSVKYERAGGTKRVEPGFTAKSKFGTAPLLWKREPDVGRFPIKPEMGKSLGKMLKDPRVINPLAGVFTTRMSAELERLIRRAMNGN